MKQKRRTKSPAKSSPPATPKAQGESAPALTSVQPRSPAASYLIAALLAILVGIAYWPVVHARFINYDDTTQIVINDHVNTGLSLANVKWAFTRAYASNYIPLTWISHMLCCRFFGLDAGGHHFVNLLLHVANTVLFFLLVGRIVNSPWPALLAAGLFGLHPVHVESVAWVAERKDVLSTLFWLLSCHAYLTYAASVAGLGSHWAGVRGGGGPEFKSAVAVSRRAYILLLAAFILGLLAKPMLVTLPFALLLLDVWPLRRTNLAHPDAEQDSSSAPQVTPWSKLILEKVPLLCLAFAACVVTFLSQESGGAVSTIARYPLSFRFGNAAVSYVAYLGRLFVPVGFSVFEPLQPRPLASLPVLGALMLLILITVLAVTQIRRRPWLTVGWFWYLGTLVPVIGIVQVGAQSMAWRYAYIPFLGIYLALAAVLAGVLRRKQIQTAIIAVPGCAMLLALSVLTWRQAARWHDNETLFRYSMEHSKRNWLAMSNLGVHLAANQRYEDAIGYLQQALTIDPTWFQAANSLGFALEHVGRNAEAIATYRHAVSLRPKDASTRENLITVLIQEKRFPEALEAADELVALDTSRAASHVSRGSVLLAAGRAAEAIQVFTHARGLDPSNDTAQYYLGMAFERDGQFQKAVDALDRPLKLNEVERINRFLTLGSSFRELKEYDKSAQILRQGFQEFPNSVEILEQLGTLEYTYLKDQPNALAHLQLVLKLNPNHPQRAEYSNVIDYLTKQLSKTTPTTNIPPAKF